MTVIAYKDGVLAADGAAWQHEIMVCAVVKIVRLRDGRLFAGCGREDLIEGCVDWLLGVGGCPEPLSADDDFQALVVDDRGAWSVSHKTFKVVGACREVMALGAHAEFLYGAMAAGASAEAAVRLAVGVCAFAGGDVQVERVLGKVGDSAVVS